MNTAREAPGGSGLSNTNALCSGGETSAPARTADTETWNGTSWTEVGNLNVARSANSASGSNSSSITMGGYDGTAVVANNEEWTGAGAPAIRTITTD